MQINSVQPTSRQQLQEDVLALIRSRSRVSGSPHGVAAQDAVKREEPADPAVQAVGTAAMETAVKAINDALQALSTNLRFEADEQSGKMLVKVIDGETGELLRQIPSETTLQIARSLDKMAGHFVNHSV